MAKKRFDVFAIQESANDPEKSFWYRVGVAWENQDGSINVNLVAAPIDGKLQIREPRERDDEGGGGGRGGARGESRGNNNRGAGGRR